MRDVYTNIWDGLKSFYLWDHVSVRMLNTPLHAKRDRFSAYTHDSIKAFIGISLSDCVYLMTDDVLCNQPVVDRALYLPGVVLTK